MQYEIFQKADGNTLMQLLAIGRPYTILKYNFWVDQMSLLMECKCTLIGCHSKGLYTL